MIKTFTIKEREIKVATAPDGRRALMPDSTSLLMTLTMQYGASLREDKEAIALGKYLEDGK